MFSLKAASLSTLCILALTAGLAGVARAQSEQESYFSPERGWGLASPAFNNPHRVSWKTAVITDQTHLHAVPAGFAQLLLTNHSPANMEFIIDPWVGRDSKGQLFIGTGWFDVHVPPLGFAHVITPSGTCAIEIAVKSEAKREEAGKISEYIFDEGHFFQDVPTGSKTTIEVSWQPLPGTGGTVSGAPPERPTTSSRIAGAPVSRGNRSNQRWRSPAFPGTSESPLGRRAAYGLGPTKRHTIRPARLRGWTDDPRNSHSCGPGLTRRSPVRLLQDRRGRAGIKRPALLCRTYPRV